MNILAINGSPRIGGNTDILLDKILAGAKAQGAGTRKIILNKLKFSPCQECAHPSDEGGCIINDDMQAVYKAVEKADVIVLGSPIFFGSITAQTKMMVDRFQCRWRAKYILKKINKQKRKTGVFICVQAAKRRDFFENARSIVKNLFAAIDVDYAAELFCMGVDEKASILAHPKILNQAYTLGKRIAS